MNSNSISYTKLKSGEWGLRVPDSALTSPVKDGDIVTVITKAGQTKAETIAKVLWRGNGIALCAVKQRPRPSASRYYGGGGGGYSGTVKCRHCGQRTAEGDDWCQRCGKANYE